MPDRTSLFRCLVILAIAGAAACASTRYGTALLSRPRLDPLQRGESLLGASVVDARKRPAGTVEDFLIDSTTGEVVGVSVSLRSPAGAAEEVMLEYGSVDWTADADAAPVLVLRRRLGDLSTDRSAHSDLFGGRGSTSVAGVIAQVETARVDAGEAILLKVRDDDNLLHRVLVDPAHLVARQFSLGPDRSVKAEGILTRDETGKLLVASTLAQDGRKLVFRDASGAILWNDLAERFQHARELSEKPVLAADGSVLSITEWVLDLVLGEVRYLYVRVDGVDRVLGWEEVEVGSEAWRVSYDTAALSALPLLGIDGRITSGP